MGMHVVIVGGVAAGPKTAAKIMRLRPDAEITILERGPFVSFAGCGLPYYVSGEVGSQKDLMATPAGAVRDAAFFQNVKKIRVLTGTEAAEIDRAARKVKARSTSSGDESWLPYDKLVLATGASPIKPPLPGLGRQNVFTLHSIPDSEGIKVCLDQKTPGNAVIIGAGLIGVETAESLVSRGWRVTLIEMLPQILSMLDWEIARLVEQHMASKGVTVLTNTKALEFRGHNDADGPLTRVLTDCGELPVDLAILSVGVRPNVTLARQCDLDIGEQTGAIRVDEHMRTSDPDIYAAGDCVECVDRLTGAACFVPLGSTANKQGRVAAINICGGKEEFPGVLGTTVCKVFDFCVARTGLTERAARGAGRNVLTAAAPGPDIAHYMPRSKSLLLKLVADAGSGRLLGVQCVGPGDGSKRIDVAATAITAGMTLDDVANLDLAYAPPYAPAMDALITGANVARNKRDGHMIGISAEEVQGKLQAGDDLVLLDVRSPQEHAEVRLPKSTLIPLGLLRKRLDEIPRDKEIIAFCKISLRGYEAALILKAAGFTNVKVLDGGVAMWPYEKEK